MFVLLLLSYILNTFRTSRNQIYYNLLPKFCPPWLTNSQSIITREFCKCFNSDNFYFCGVTILTAIFSFIYYISKAHTKLTGTGFSYSLMFLFFCYFLENHKGFSCFKMLISKVYECIFPNCQNAKC